MSVRNMLKKGVTLLSIGVIFGSVGGGLNSLHLIFVNQYIPHQMFILAIDGLKTRLNRWVILSLFPLLLFMGMRGLWVFWMRKSNAGEETQQRMFYATMVCFLCLGGGGWLLNHYWLPYRFHPISLLGDVGIFIAAVVLGRLFARARGERYFIRLENFLESARAKFLRDVAFVSVFLLFALNGYVILHHRFNPPERPNVLILLVDALRRDHLGVYGYSRDTSPNIDQFSQEAVVFKGVSQASWTSPAVASLFSAFYPSIHGVDKIGSKRGVLDSRFITLAEVLKENGYATAAFVGNPLVNKKLHFDQGFDVYEELVDSVDLGMHIAPLLHEKAFRWIRRHPRRPFFIYLHYIDVHAPYSPPPPYDSFFRSAESRLITDEEVVRLIHPYLSEGKVDKNLSSYIDRYDGEIRCLDEQIGNFLRHLKEEGLSDQTIIVVTADHGEAFFEHGMAEHGFTLYREEINIPLLIKFPGSAKADKATHPYGSLIDVGPTILSSLGLSFPYKTNGRNLLDFENKTSEPRIFSEFLSTWAHQRIALREGNWKAIYLLAAQKVTELYDLANDPLERESVLDRHPDETERLTHEIRTWCSKRIDEKNRLQIKAFPIILKDRETVGRLRSLGYLH